MECDGALKVTSDGKTWAQGGLTAEPRCLASAPDGSQVLAFPAGFLHRFFVVTRYDRNLQAQGCSCPGGTGQTCKRREELTMMGGYGNGTGSLGWLGMGVFWLVLVGLIVWLVLRLLPGRRDGGTTRDTGESTLDILDRRMAKGEIDTQTWQAQRAALTGATRDQK
jgi:putative membrane protein